MGPYLDAVKGSLRSQALRATGSLKRMGALLHESCAQIGHTFAGEGFRAGVKALCSRGLALIRAKNYRPVTMASAMLVLCVAFTFMMGRGALVYSQVADTTGIVNSR
ncbi:MAG: hypothetical protein P4M02_05610, partial [Clostridia bacterium]|nr:hypothetical protein [Clostridia bacterium]